MKCKQYQNWSDWNDWLGTVSSLVMKEVKEKSQQQQLKNIYIFKVEKNVCMHAHTYLPTCSSLIMR
jgi:hypothetical protein